MEKIHKAPLSLLILESTSSREKIYRFIQFLIRFLSPIQKTKYCQAVYLFLQKINWNVSITRHINRFGMALSLINQIKQKYFNKNIKTLTISEILQLGGTFCILVFSIVDHFILLSKIKAFNAIPLQTLYKTLGVFWFLGNTTQLIHLLSLPNIQRKSVKERCNIIKCLCDYIIIFHFSTQERILPNWICGLAGMISSALGLYTKYLITDKEEN